MNWAAHLIGAFYVFAGIVGLRAMAMDRLFDAAISAITLGPPSEGNERTKSLWLTFGAALTLAGGVSLLILSVLAPGLFLANLAVQTGYLFWAQRALPPEDATDRVGRQRTVNAAFIYAGATIFAVWALPEYARSNFAFGPLPSLAVECAVILLVTGGAYFYFFNKTRLRVDASDQFDTNLDDDVELDDESHEISSGLPKALRVVPEIGRTPICDDFTGEDVPLESLPISDGLRRRISTWNESYEGSQSSEAFFVEGEAIIAELRKEWNGTVVSNIRRDWG